MTAYSFSSPVATIDNGRRPSMASRLLTQQQPRHENRTWIAQQQEGSRFFSDNRELQQEMGAQPWSPVGRVPQAH